MQLYTGLKTFKLWLDSKRGGIPGWTYIIALVIVLFVIILGFIVAGRSGKSMVELLGDLFE